MLALGTPRLAWETVVSSHTGAIPSKLHVFTDAATGAVAYSYDEVREGTGTAHYNGPSPVAIDTTHSGSTLHHDRPDPVGHLLPRLHQPRGAVRHRTTCGATASAPTRRPAAWTRCSTSSTSGACSASWLGRNGINGTGGGYPI